ncbi:hypothetical protein TL16_g09114 [Triparma laevis f. inornata]|uniref:Uncharacterized protein n=1 Tax=Triparma laevis f. inornata TaxID=1714386 RepID=A0A9W7B8X5_9STRA|nr:hypothetical protein TL16_g09114 [Triparma laevis f. inornata]
MRPQTPSLSPKSLKRPKTTTDEVPESTALSSTSLKHLENLASGEGFSEYFQSLFSAGYKYERLRKSKPGELSPK